MALRTLRTTLRPLRTTLRTLPKKTDDFYATAAWRAARAEALRRAGRRCCVCNAAHVRLFVDHVVEVRDGGALLDQRNLQVLCGKHHSLKTEQARLMRIGRLQR